VTEGTSTTPNLLLITGDPGAGKTTLMRRLVALPGFRRWASWTTRAPRPGEIDGFDYVFVDDQAFMSAVARGEMLEHLVGPGGARYGLPQPPTTRLDECLVAIVDEAAAERLPALLPGYEVSVRHLAAPKEILAERMRGRGDAEDAIAARLVWAARDLAQIGAPK